jgi:hypothetical protein
MITDLAPHPFNIINFLLSWPSKIPQNKEACCRYKKRFSLTTIFRKTPQIKIKTAKKYTMAIIC